MKLETRTISFYRDFSCLCSSCRETCCRGWKVLIDEAAADMYRGTPGLLGLRLRFRMSGHGEPAFDLSEKDCAFHRKDGLCELQLTRGADFMPEVCRVYPRMTRNYGAFAERWLDLSCMGAGSLFLQSEGRLTQYRSLEDIREKKEGNNDDDSFLHALEFSRELLLDYLYDDSRFSDPAQSSRSFGHLIRYALEAQNACVRGSYDFFSIPPDSAADTGQDDILFFRDWFPFPEPLLHKLFFSGFYKSSLKRQAPDLYRLCCLYQDTFDGLSSLGRAHRAEALVGDYLSSRPDGIRKYISYYAYSLYQYYFNIFEDYSFLLWMLRGLIDANMLLMLDALVWNRRKSLPPDDEARILAVFERRAHHNPTIFESLYQITRKYCIG